MRTKIVRELEESGDAICGVIERQSKASLEVSFRATWCRRDGNASKKNAVNNYEAATVRNCALRACSEKSDYV
jgi:hypothetical protein